MKKLFKFVVVIILLTVTVNVVKAQNKAVYKVKPAAISVIIQKTSAEYFVDKKKKEASFIYSVRIVTEGDTLIKVLGQVTESYGLRLIAILGNFEALIKKTIAEGGTFIMEGEGFDLNDFSFSRLWVKGYVFTTNKSSLDSSVMTEEEKEELKVLKTLI